MITLKKIKKQNNHIICDAYVEDSKDAIYLCFDYASEQFADYSIPKGYEYCKMHIIQARNYFLKIKDRDTIPQEKVLMWY